MHRAGADIIFFFFFNDTATTEIYTLSLHDALPILSAGGAHQPIRPGKPGRDASPLRRVRGRRSEEHTSELQSRPHLVCRLLLEKKKTTSASLSATTPPFSATPWRAK